MALRQDSEDGFELTEKLVLTRTRAPDLDSVKKLNCWASNINEVSIVRKLPNLEVCSLSINRITTLRDFAHCYKLKELYVRTNKIQCLGDIHYLKNLSRLRYLWLSENPCADKDNYRLTVLRTLPRLQKLDNTAVTYEEVQEALSTVEEIPIPEDFSASSMFDRPLNISSVSSVSSVSLDDVLSSRSPNTDFSPRESLPVVRRKREQRRQKKAEEDSARRSAEEEFVKTSLEKKRMGIEACGDKERKSSIDSSDNEGDYDDDDEEDKDDGSNENVSDDVKASTDSETSRKSCDGSKSPLSNDDVSDGDFVREGGGDGGCDDKNNKGGGGENSIGGVHGISNENIVSQELDSSEAFSNRDNNSSNSDAFDQRNIISESDYDKDMNNCNDNNNNEDECNDDNKHVGEKQFGSGGKKFGSDFKDANNLKVKADLTSDSLLDKIRLDDSLAFDDHDVGRGDPSHDSIELDDLIVEIGEENQNQTLTNECSTENHRKDESTDDVCGVSKQSDSDKDPLKDPLANANNRSDSTAASTSTPRSDSGNGSSTASQKESVDWEQYNRMRQDIGMRPIERGPVTARPLSANVARARNGNILQAVFSLVKELDKDSLELVASAVKARIDTL